MSDSTASPFDFGVSLSRDGLNVDLNPNPVQLRVRPGTAGVLLSVEAMGLCIRVALPDAARKHLVLLLQAPAVESAAA